MEEFRQQGTPSLRKALSWPASGQASYRVRFGSATRFFLPQAAPSANRAGAACGPADSLRHSTGSFGLRQSRTRPLEVGATEVNQRKPFLPRRRPEPLAPVHHQQRQAASGRSAPKQQALQARRPSLRHRPEIRTWIGDSSGDRSAPIPALFPAPGRPIRITPQESKRILGARGWPWRAEVRFWLEAKTQLRRPAQARFKRKFPAAVEERTSRFRR